MSSRVTKSFVIHASFRQAGWRDAFLSDGIFLAQVRAHVYVVKRHRRQSDELSEIEE